MRVRTYPSFEICKVIPYSYIKINLILSLFESMPIVYAPYGSG